MIAIATPAVAGVLRPEEPFWCLDLDGAVGDVVVVVFAVFAVVVADFELSDVMAVILVVAALDGAGVDN